MNRARLLIVEDDPGFARVLALETSEAGYEVRCAAHEMAVVEMLSAWCPSHAVVDLRLKGASGLAIIDILKAKTPSCRVVMLTGYGSVPTAVEAVKRGAAEYLTKPVSTPDLLGALAGQHQTGLPANDLDRESLARHEHEYIEYVLTCCEGNISKAARWLGIHRQSLQRKLRKYPPVR